MMKNSSIKKRVTLYYSLVLILITLFVFGVFLFTASRQITVVSQNTVMSAVQDSFEEVDYDNNIIEIDNDFDSYSKGVTLLVYSSSGELIKGSIPRGFPSYMPLTSGSYQEIEGENGTWLYYDLYNTYENGEGLWVRGIYAMDTAAETLRSIMLIIAVSLPALLIFAIIAGRRITKRAFEPVAEITKAANSINSGHDLSRRLPQGENRDELYFLTQTLNQMMERLEDAFKAEKEFSSDVSHELKTPISVILAECEYTLEENRSIEEYKESIENIQKQCMRTMSMIQQLLQVSRTIDKAKALDKEDIDLSMLSESIVSELSLVAKEEGVLLESDIEKHIEICADETLIMRMILNLLTNAIKYSKEVSRPKIKLSVRRDDQVYIVVEDNGIGIKKEDQTNIFNRFYKVDKSRKAEENSFGLGLSMVKWIAEAHDGKVEVESEIGKGSRFTVTLP
ncbi:MAG: sensor histidine kinase [Anaerovoracaceae bacterium]